MKTLEELQKEYDESKNKLKAAKAAYQQAIEEEINAHFALQKEEYKIENKEVYAKMASIPEGTILLSKNGSCMTCASDYDLIYIASIQKFNDDSFSFGLINYYKFEKRGKSVTIKTYEAEYVNGVNCWLFNIPKASDRNIKLVKNYLTKYTKLLGGK